MLSRRARQALLWLLACSSVAAAPPPVAAAPAAAAPHYAVTDRWVVGGSGSWDYLTVDAARQRLFVTRGDRIEVFDTATGKLLGRIAGTAGVHAVVLVPELGRGFATSGRANAITEFDYATLAVIREGAVRGEHPDALLYEPLSRRLFAFNARSKSATVLEAASLAVVAELALPDKPEFAVADEHGRVYVNIQSENGRIAVIDAAGPAVIASWAMPGCAYPTGLALDRAHRRLFSTCDGNVMAVTDADGGRAVARVPIGGRPDGAEFDPGTGLAFSANGDGTLSIIREETPERFSVAATLATERGARTLALDPVSHRIYLVTAEFGPAPAATAETPNPRPPPLPDTFRILVAAPH